MYGEPINLEDFIKRSGFTPYPPPIWSPIILPEEKNYFIPYPILDQVRNAYFAHVWNSNRVKELMTNSTIAYVVLAQKYCPRVLKASGEFF